MSLRSWIRGHRNVFSYTNEWVDAERGTADDLGEEYGEQASEESRVNSNRPLRLLSGSYWGSSLFGRLFSGGGTRAYGPQSSVDGILEIGKDGAEEEKPPPARTP